MKKHILSFVMAAAAALPVAVSGAAPFVPVGSKIDVEALGSHIDTGMDISGLSLQDLRILRNAFAARQGYCFTDYALRAVFGHTSWYDSLLWERLDGSLYDKPIKYTKAELTFIDKIKAREAELKAQNFKAGEGERVNVRNIVNGFQLEEVSEPLYARLARDGFAIVPRQNIQLFHCYENNDYHDFPSFVTTDLHLQLMHIYYSNIMQEMEKASLSVSFMSVMRQLYGQLEQSLARSTSDNGRETARWCMAWVAVYGRLAGMDGLQAPPEYGQAVADEVARITQADDALSPFLGFTDVKFMYSLFRPRGYYTASELQQRYFRSMMWLQSAPFCIDDKVQLRRAVRMADALNGSVGARGALMSIDKVMAFMVGRADGLSLLDLAGELKRGKYNTGRLMRDDALLARLQQSLLKKSRAAARIRPKEQLSCAEKICLMPQRYVYDSEVLQELVDVQTKPQTLRGCPTGLDVMAALGSAAARSILIDELEAARQWPEYAARLDAVARLMPRMTADSSATNLRLKALAAMTGCTDTRLPYFMRTPQWAKKSLNAALAAWAETRHDITLYAKQPMAAECGGAIPDPVVVGYVEPNVAYWAKSLELVRRLRSVLSYYGFLSPRIKSLTDQVEEQTAFLLRIAQKELAGRRVTPEEFKSIEKIGSTYEWLTLDIMKDKARQDGMVWEDVQGPDRSVAVVADVYTANGSNNPNKSVLHAATGYVDDIFVVVEINGMLHLTRGAVFSYREFPMPLGTRLTDEEWQQMLEKEPRRGVPSWMDEVILTDPVPADNELIFYSSGC